jgi:hypothetical protein
MRPLKTIDLGDENFIISFKHLNSTLAFSRDQLLEKRRLVDAKISGGHASLASVSRTVRWCHVKFESKVWSARECELKVIEALADFNGLYKGTRKSCLGALLLKLLSLSPDWSQRLKDSIAAFVDQNSRLFTHEEVERFGSI